jgi:hypothetical protein
MGFEPRNILIIISCVLMDVEKRVMDYRLHVLFGAGTSHFSAYLEREETFLLKGGQN